MDTNKTTKRFYFGQYWQLYGTNSIEVPAHFTIEEAMEHVRANWDDIGLASGASYVMGSDEPDFESGHFDEEEDDNA